MNCYKYKKYIYIKYMYLCETIVAQHLAENVTVVGSIPTRGQDYFQLNIVVINTDRDRARIFRRLTRIISLSAPSHYPSEK